MKYTVKQINLTDAQVNEVNSSESYPEFYKKYLDTIMRPTAEAIKAAYDMYEVVAKITADSLEGVFEAGNIGPEEKIERIAPMHSVSVGDIVADEDGREYFVASFGFQEVI